jgi:hypothetical protein
VAQAFAFGVGIPPAGCGHGDSIQGDSE